MTKQEDANLQLRMRRLGVVMEPEPGNPREAGGVMNPGTARGRDGDLYLFPRLVAEGNYSRIGFARVKFNDAGDPAGVERLGTALEPEADYECRGCEDPRITFVEPLQHYVMTYTALSRAGPRVALAVSRDLFTWERLGLASFEPFGCLNFNHINNKDALFFPCAIPGPDGRPAFAIVHRPLFPGTCPDELRDASDAAVVDIEKESIWISYCLPENDDPLPQHLCHFSSHRRLAMPAAPWENLKIGSGTPPILTPHGWLLIYHGVCAAPGQRDPMRGLRYAAGLLMLDQEQPHIVRFRSADPFLTPELPEEREGRVANVVFPTGIDRRDDLGLSSRFDVYYGMADSRIGAARLDVQEDRVEA